MRGVIAVPVLITVCSILYPGSARAQSTTPQQELQQYIADLSKSPADLSLREKIITLAKDMNPPPSIPEEARRHYVVAKTLFEGAKKPADFNDAVDEFSRALFFAPWWAEANRDLGLALESAGRFDEAIAFIRLYTAAAPGEDRVRAAQDEIYKIEAKKRLAARDARDQQAARDAESRAAAEQARAKAEQARRESLEGRWCDLGPFGRCITDSWALMEIRSNGGQWTITFPGATQMTAYDIRQGGKRIAFTRLPRGSDPELNTDYLDLTLSPDGNELSGTIRSVSISGNQPHWTTDTIKYARQ